MLFLSRPSLACAVLIFAAFSLQPALAQQRLALLIGNGQYRHVPALLNPSNDTADLGAALQRLGFAVEQVFDANFETMRRALVQFSEKARSAEMALVFFAGHGMEIGGENWLIPVDAEMKTDLSIEHEAVNLKSVMLAVSSASTLGLVLLDACRNNPFAAKMARTGRTRTVSRGFTRVEPSRSVLVVYAARDGTTAADGVNRNSPFTTALLRHLEKPGLEINFLFRHVRDEVLATTQREQEPFVYGSLSKDAIYLAPPSTVPPIAAPAAAPPEPVGPGAVSSGPESKTKRTNPAAGGSIPAANCYVFERRRFCE